MMQRVGLYWHTFPTYSQGKKVIWDGTTRDGRKFLDHFPEDLVASRNDTDMRITFKNGSVYQVVGVDDPNRLVGGNPIGIVYSEYSLQNPKAWDLMRPILNENGGWALFIYTARGDNHGKFLYDAARENQKWFSELLTVDNTRREATDPVSGKVLLGPDGKPILVPVVTQEQIDEDRKMGMPEELVQQEYYNSFDAPLVGAYYAQQMLLADTPVLNEDGTIQSPARISAVPWEPNLPVDTAWDLGVDDETTIWFIQEYGHEIRIIDCYEHSDVGLAHYAKILNQKPYAYRKHYAPHDITVRELGSGKSRLHSARELGIRFIPVPKLHVADGIEAVRNILPRCWFDKEKCKPGIKALRSYRRIYDPDKKVYRDEPFHDWSSHFADSFRTFAVGRKDRPKNDKPRQTTTNVEYPMFTCTR
jgi:phage terminase large subunit